MRRLQNKLNRKALMLEFQHFSTLEQLDITRMLQCFVNQKVDLQCDGGVFNPGNEQYNVTHNAERLEHICSKGTVDRSKSRDSAYFSP